VAPTTSDRAGDLRALGRELAASVATVAETGALPAFATVGTFTGDSDPFLHSVVAPVEPSSQGPR
jgi:hypothetical protein